MEPGRVSRPKEYPLFTKSQRKSERSSSKNDRFPGSALRHGPVRSTTKAPTTASFGAQALGFGPHGLRFVRCLTTCDAKLVSRCGLLNGTGLATRRTLTIGFRLLASSFPRVIWRKDIPDLWAGALFQPSGGRCCHAEGLPVECHPGADRHGVKQRAQGEAVLLAGADQLPDSFRWLIGLDRELRRDPPRSVRSVPAQCSSGPS